MGECCHSLLTLFKELSYEANMSAQRLDYLCTKGTAADGNAAIKSM